MKAAVYYPEQHAIQIDDRAPAIPGADQILIQVAAAGICGSDMHYYRDGHIGDWWVKQPHVLGHEFAGTVAAVGENVDGFSIGDRVCIEPIIPCETCHACNAGLYNLCTNLKFTGSPHTDGAFQEYVVSRPRFTHKIPDNMSLELAALVEPTSIAVHAVHKSRLTSGDTVAVIGAGPIGLLTIAVARANGAGRIFVADLDPARLEKAEQLGATDVIAPGTDAASAIYDATNGRGVHLTFEAVGIPVTLETALQVTRPGGRLTVIGVTPEDTIPFNLMLAQSREIEVIPIYLGRDAFPAAIDLLSSGQVDAREIVTHRFELEQADHAMQTAVQRRDNAIKVILTTPSIDK